mmetsp:Transcript_16056/g.55878  ORF Transcript_16056/g.55878 Transcript_16056/m.55878 type:complete len:1173 (+) Transcript_16056:106-3624(+)
MAGVEPRSPTYGKMESMKSTLRPGKSVKNRKMRSSTVTVEDVVKVVKQDFAGNAFTGAIKSDPLGVRHFSSKSSTYNWPQEAIYEGPFVGSTIVGSGKFTWPDGSVYEGQLNNGKRHGKGIFIAGDSVTKYEGQWFQGKRHGQGKLSYGASSDAHYEGEWSDGCKHGHGVQVWPSGNVYEGQWRLGRMAGEGKMTWSDGGVAEHYQGHWEDDHPQGRGAHTWEASAPPRLASDQGARDMPSQQMNNNYTGEWRRGVRHGEGAFSYANGAMYNGGWMKNLKEGQGRYTFEDGRVYDGAFAGDAFAERGGTPGALSSASIRVLNIGAEDNPVRRCVDISDLNPLCLPPDVGALDLEVGSGYDEDHEVMREVFNMLLRYLGEVKQIYSVYRLLLRRPGEDPFVLTSHQLWLLCRDLDLVTPDCPLGRLNRAVFAGPRHHLETAHADLEGVRPLTPRHMSSPRDAIKERRPSIPQSKWIRTAKTVGLLSRLLPSQKKDHPKDEAKAIPKSSSSRSSSRSSGSQDSDDEPEGDASRGSVKAKTAEALPLSPSGDSLLQASFVKLPQRAATDFVPAAVVAKLQAGGPEVQTRSMFWRPEGGEAETHPKVKLADIHTSTNKLMLRHFLESLVRMAVARFPNEKGLEHQVRRLFKEKVLPAVPSVPSMAFEQKDVLGHLTDAEVQSVFSEHEQALVRVFKENHAGEGPSWDAPPWAQAAAQFAPGIVFEAPERRGPMEAVGAAEVGSAAGSRRGSATGAMEATVSAAADAAGPSPRAAAGASPHAAAVGSAAREEGHAGGEVGEEEVGKEPSRPLRMPMLPGRRRRGWGGTQRRAHVCARADATVRVKDVLRLLDDTGLLAPLAGGWGRSSSSTGGPAEAELDAHSEGSAPQEGAGPDAPWNDLMGLTGCVLPGHIPSSSRPTTHGSVGTHARGSPGAGSAGGAAVAMAGDGVGDAEGGYPAVGPEGHRQQSRSPTDSSSNRRSVLPSKTMPLHQNRLSAPSEEPKLNRLLTSPDVNTMVGFYSSECSAGGSVGGGQSGREVQDSLSQYDFSISFMEALQVLTEVLSPASLGRIRWSVAADEEPRQELITLLDYLEMEVTFVEFQRFLFRAVELAERRQGVVPVTSSWGRFSPRALPPTSPIASSWGRSSPRSSSLRWTRRMCRRRRGCRRPRGRRERLL